MPRFAHMFVVLFAAHAALQSCRTVTSHRGVGEGDAVLDDAASLTTMCSGFSGSHAACRNVTSGAACVDGTTLGSCAVSDTFNSYCQCAPLLPQGTVAIPSENCSGFSSSAASCRNRSPGTLCTAGSAAGLCAPSDTFNDYCGCGTLPTQYEFDYTTNATSCSGFSSSAAACRNVNTGSVCATADSKLGVCATSDSFNNYCSCAAVSDKVKAPPAGSLTCSSFSASESSCRGRLAGNACAAVSGKLGLCALSDSSNRYCSCVEAPDAVPLPSSEQTTCNASGSNEACRGLILGTSCSTNTSTGICAFSDSLNKTCQCAAATSAVLPSPPAGQCSFSSSTSASCRGNAFGNACVAAGNALGQCIRSNFSNSDCSCAAVSMSSTTLPAITTGTCANSSSTVAACRNRSFGDLCAADTTLGLCLENDASNNTCGCAPLPSRVTPNYSHTAVICSNFSGSAAGCRSQASGNACSKNGELGTCALSDASNSYCACVGIPSQAQPPPTSFGSCSTFSGSHAACRGLQAGTTCARENALGECVLSDSFNNYCDCAALPSKPSNLSYGGVSCSSFSGSAAGCRSVPAGTFCAGASQGSCAVADAFNNYCSCASVSSNSMPLPSSPPATPTPVPSSTPIPTISVAPPSPPDAAGLNKVFNPLIAELRALHPGCTGPLSKDVTFMCRSAVRRYCAARGFPGGLLLEYDSVKNAQVVCLRGEFVSPSLNILRVLHSSCTGATGPVMLLACDSAVTRYCGGGYAGGFLQEYNAAGNSTAGICVSPRSSVFAAPSIATLRRFHPACSGPWNLHSSPTACNSAYSNYCRSLGKGYVAGFITNYDSANSSTGLCVK